jgi:hypothetical protein
MAKSSLRSSLQTVRRSVKRYDEDGTLIGTDTPDASYKWVVQYGSNVYEINADIHLPCISVDQENLGAKVATLMKIGLPNGELKYGPMDVYEGHIQAWIAAQG